MCETIARNITSSSVGRTYENGFVQICWSSRLSL